MCARACVCGGVILCKKKKKKGEGSYEEIKMFMLGELGLLVAAADPAGWGCVRHSFRGLIGCSPHVTWYDVSRL